jgi:hypothetical protein
VENDLALLQQILSGRPRNPARTLSSANDANDHNIRAASALQ